MSYFQQQLNMILLEDLSIINIDPEDEWELAEQGAQAISNSGIRPDRGKDISLVAMHGDDVVGGVASGWDGNAFSFDVGIDPTFIRHNLARAGLKLIDAAIDLFDSESEAYERPYMRLHVVNPQLAKYLEYNRDFEVSPVGGNHFIAERY
jgi:hypothetical protein